MTGLLWVVPTFPLLTGSFCELQQCAQVLLTLDNLADRNQYLNASNTFQELFQMRTIPIVNENDTVAVQQLRFGDNDTLSAEVGGPKCCLRSACIQK